MTKKLIVFDVDGVLLDNKMGGAKDVLVILGKEKEVREIDEEYQRRKAFGPWGLEELMSLYQGFSEDELREVARRYCRENLMKGARDCLLELKTKGFCLGAISSNPQFIMDALAETLPLDFLEGTQFEFKDGIATGKIQRKVDRNIKAEILKEKMKVYELEKDDVVVVGDSITDLPMVELAGTFVAFRPKEDKVKEKATLVIKEFKELIEAEL